MKVKLVKPVVMLALVFIAMGITSCGSGGGSTSYFKTVTVVPVGTIPDATSTVLATPNTTDPTVTVTLQSTSYPGVSTPSPVTVQSTTIRYFRTADTPVSAPATLPDQHGTAGQIPANGTLALSMTTASSLFKDNLVAQQGFSPGSSRWRYSVRYYFTMVEDYTNTSVTSIVDGGTITFQ